MPKGEKCACNRSKEINERLASEATGNMRLKAEIMNSFQLKPFPSSKSGSNITNDPLNRLNRSRPLNLGNTCGSNFDLSMETMVP